MINQAQEFLIAGEWKGNGNELISAVADETSTMASMLTGRRNVSKRVVPPAVLLFLSSGIASGHGLFSCFGANFARGV